MGASLCLINHHAVARLKMRQMQQRVECAVAIRIVSGGTGKKCTRADLIIIIIVVVIAASLCHGPLIDDRRSHSVMYLEGINSLQQQQQPPPPEESDPLNLAQKVTSCDTATRNQEKWTLCGHLSE
jgi:hypothetical protein